MKIVLKSNFTVALVTALALIPIILLLPKFLPHKLPLFYSLPWGELELADTNQFLILPGVFLIITFTNLVIARQLHQQQTLLKRILLLSSLFCGLILTLTILKIIFIFL